MNVRRGFGLALTVLATASAPALAAKLSAQSMELEGRVDARILTRVEPVFAAAARDSLPMDVLRAKVLEGATKNRPPELIARVVTDLAEDLRATRTALRERLPDAAISGRELAAASLARGQGVPMESLADLWSSRPAGGSLQIPVTVLGELVRRGVPPDEASAVMRHIIDTGVPLERAAQIPGRLDGVTRPDVAPPEALERALRDLDIPAPPAGRGPGG
ncbi:MAG: hypothetical protein U5R14_00930 [Gemmatimonadota bacterium]|nr:hypothetical protein [Gemmatimonadota bacterium]